MAEHARPEPQGNMHQAKQDRYFYEGADGSGQGRTRVDTEDRDGHGDSEFEIVARRRERLRRGRRIIGADPRDEDRLIPFKCVSA